VGLGQGAGEAAEFHKRSRTEHNTSPHSSPTQTRLLFFPQPPSCCPSPSKNQSRHNREIGSENRQCQIWREILRCSSCGFSFTTLVSGLILEERTHFLSVRVSVVLLPKSASAPSIHVLAVPVLAHKILRQEGPPLIHPRSEFSA
jgi:hypothetical protein